MKLHDIILWDDHYAYSRTPCPRLAVFCTQLQSGEWLELHEWIHDNGLSVEETDSNVRCNQHVELQKLEKEGRNAFDEMNDALQPKNLDELFEAMKGEQFDRADWTDLPNFGEFPDDTLGVWSWDETRQIVGTCAEDILIEDRND